MGQQQELIPQLTVLAEIVFRKVQANELSLVFDSAEIVTER